MFRLAGLIVEKVRMMRDKARQGLDCCTFEVVFQGEIKNLPEQPLINERGKKYGTVEVKNGTATVALVLPRFIRDNNVQPFTLADSNYLEGIRADCEEQLKPLLGAELESKIKSIEVNITQRVSGNAAPSDVLNFLNHACLSPVRDNVKYVGASKKCKYKEETHTVICRRNGYHIIKAYDKFQQQKKELEKQNKNSDTVPSGMLRIEIIMLERTLRKLFGDKTSFSQVLTRDGLIAVLREYKRIFCEEFIELRVKEYLRTCVSLLIESLCETQSPVATIAKERELIPDAETFHRALEQWRKLRGRSTHNVRRESEHYATKFNLPRDIVRTLHDFKVACG